MKAKVGAVLNRASSFPASRSDIRKWALAVYFPRTPPRMFRDEGFAQGTPHRRIGAPEDFSPFAWIVADPLGAPGVLADADSLESRLGIERSRLENQLNGALEAHYHPAIRPGRVITSERMLAGYDERSGRLGQMLLTAIEDRWTNDRGDLVKVLQQMLIRY